MTRVWRDGIFFGSFWGSFLLFFFPSDTVTFTRGVGTDIIEAVVLVAAAAVVFIIFCEVRRAATAIADVCTLLC